MKRFSVVLALLLCAVMLFSCNEGNGTTATTGTDTDTDTATETGATTETGAATTEWTQEIQGETDEGYRFTFKRGLNDAKDILILDQLMYAPASQLEESGVNGTLFVSQEVQYELDEVKQENGVYSVSGNMVKVATFGGGTGLQQYIDYLERTITDPDQLEQMLKMLERTEYEGEEEIEEFTRWYDSTIKATFTIDDGELTASQFVMKYGIYGPMIVNEVTYDVVDGVVRKITTVENDKLDSIEEFRANGIREKVTYYEENGEISNVVNYDENGELIPGSESTL